jgi:hypothetical protein
MTWLWFTTLALCAFAGVAVGAAALGARRWRAATQVLATRIEAGRIPPAPRCYALRELEGLPAPVQRYFRAVLKEGQPMIVAAVVEHTGMLNMSATGEKWKPFTSRQRVVTRRPGFMWDARIAMFPGLAVRVHDAYAAGEGVLHAALLGLFNVADLRGGGDLARGELMRFLAEAAWYPTALLPSQGAQWSPVDDHSSNVTYTDGAVSLTLLFRFNDAGLIDSMRAEARGRMVGKVTTTAPWEGSWSDYQVCDGMTVPMTGEVAWLLPDGRKPYWRGSITLLHYDFVK